MTFSWSSTLTSRHICILRMCTVQFRRVVAVDLQGNGRRDLLIAVNNGPLIVFENRAKIQAATSARGGR